MTTEDMADRIRELGAQVDALLLEIALLKREKETK